jgi:hypothetical protein
MAEPTRVGVGAIPQELNGAAKAANQRYRRCRDSDQQRRMRSELAALFLCGAE